MTSAEVLIRERSWLFEIALACLPEDAAWTDGGNGWRRFEHTNGLCINVNKACWFRHSDGKHGISSRELIRLLKPEEDAEQWLRAWLDNPKHAGTGSCTPVDGDEDDEVDPVSVARCAQILAGAVRAEDTLGETHLRSRGLEPPYPDCVRYLANARSSNGEGALVGILTAHERTVGVQLLYLDPMGRKSLRQPPRNRFNLEKAPGAVFRLPPPPETLAGPTDNIADYAVVEGLEDALTLLQLGRPWTILGLPGIAALSQLDLPKKSRVVVFEDGDEKDSPADRGCVRGLDHLIDAGMYVWTVPTPLGLDANEILQEPRLGLDGLRALLRRENLFSPLLSLEGDIRQLSRMNEAEYEKTRSIRAKSHGVRVGYIDEEVRKLRASQPTPKTGSGEGEGEDVGAIVDDPAWTASVVLADTLEAAVAEMPHYLVAPKWQLDVIALWGAATHLVHNEAVALPIMPQLAFQSDTHDAGKSTGLEIAKTLSSRGHLRGSYTSATIFRKITEDRCSLFLVDLHNTLTPQNLELKQIVDACHRRAESLVDRVENRPDGSRRVQTYACWAALGWTSIGPMIQEVQSRAIVLPTRSALPAEYRKLRADAPPSASKVLIDARRQLAAWAATINQPLEPKLPDALFNRLASNWRPLYAIAVLAGGPWPALVQTAMEEVRKVETRAPLNVRLLLSIKEAFGADANPDDFLGSSDLVNRLCAEEEAGWDEEHHGRRITPYWLRHALRGLLDPAGSQQYNYEDPAGSGIWHNKRGYYLHQFRDSFLRHLPPTRSALSALSALDAAKAADSADAFQADGAADPLADPLGEKPSKPAAERSHSADQADQADQTSIAGEEPAPTLAEQLAEKLGSVSSASNGPVVNPDSERKLSAIEVEVLKQRAENPKRSAAWIGKQVGRSRSTVLRILANGKPPEGGAV